MQQEPYQQVWIYIDESDRLRGRALSLHILDALRTAGCPGATVLRGIGGYGIHGVLHTDLAVELSSHLPLVITFVDKAERVAQILPKLRELVTEGMITLTPVTVIQTGRRPAGPFPPHLTVADVMSRDIAWVRPDTPAAAIVSLLIDRALRAVPVVDAEQRVIGIVTDGDLLNRGVTMLPVRLKRLLPLDERVMRISSLEAKPQRAADLMTPNPITLPASASLAQAAAVMTDHNLKRLPVVDEHGRLLGMVSRLDLLQTIAEGMRQHPEMPVQLPEGAPSTVESLMITDVPTVSRDTPLAETLDRLLETERRRVVVVDAEQRVIGIISDGDVLRRAGRRVQPGMLQRLAAWFAGGARPEGLELTAQGRTAADVMTSPVFTVTSDTPITEVIRLMMTYKIKWLPVVDQDRRLIGMIGRAAVLSALAYHAENPTE